MGCRDALVQGRAFTVALGVHTRNNLFKSERWRISMQRSFRILLVLTVLSTLSACPQPNPIALIHYTQVGACLQANAPAIGQETAPASSAFVVFSVGSVDNTQVNTAWEFYPGLLKVFPPKKWLQSWANN